MGRAADRLVVGADGQTCTHSLQPVSAASFIIAISDHISPVLRARMRAHISLASPPATIWARCSVKAWNPNGWLELAQAAPSRPRHAAGGARPGRGAEWHPGQIAAQRPHCSRPRRSSLSGGGPARCRGRSSRRRGGGAAPARASAPSGSGPRCRARRRPRRGAAASSPDPPASNRAGRAARSRARRKRSAGWAGRRSSARTSVSPARSSTRRLRPPASCFDGRWRAHDTPRRVRLANAANVFMPVSRSRRAWRRGRSASRSATDAKPTRSTPSERVNSRTDSRSSAARRGSVSGFTRRRRGRGGPARFDDRHLISFRYLKTYEMPCANARQALSLNSIAFSHSSSGRVALGDARGSRSPCARRARASRRSRVSERPALDLLERLHESQHLVLVALVDLGVEPEDAHITASPWPVGGGAHAHALEALRDVRAPST